MEPALVVAIAPDLRFSLVVRPAYSAVGSSGWTPGSIGNALSFGAVGPTLRLHLWFTSRVYPSELRTQRYKTARWVRGADWTFVLVLLGAAALSQTAISATLLGGTAVATLVASLVIEPATTRAAFPHTDAP